MLLIPLGEERSSSEINHIWSSVSHTSASVKQVRVRLPQPPHSRKTMAGVLEITVVLQRDTLSTTVCFRAGTIPWERPSMLSNAPIILSDQLTDINITFYFNGGVLSWSTTDVSAATFYQCDSGPVYAAFENTTPPGLNCQPAVIGGVAAAACPVDYTDHTSTAVATSIQTVQSNVDITPSSAPTTTSSP